MNRSCGTCKSNLGGGCCKLNSERECMDDDERPLWEPRTVFKDYVDAADYRDLLQPDAWSAAMVDGKVHAKYE